MKTLFKPKINSFPNPSLETLRFLIFLLMIVIAVTLNAQNYTFVRSSFNAAGGMMQNSQYSAQIAVGEDVQGTSTTSIYTGFFGFLFPILDQRPPIITSVDDVPNDQGLRVQVVWNKCAFDDEYNQDAFYSIWRQDEDFELVLEDGNDSHQSLPDNVFTNPNDVLQLQDIHQEKMYWLADDLLWTFLGEIPALHYNEYSYIAETLSDYSSTYPNPATFKVVFHDDFAYYESESASGFSMDNIAPDPAENLMIAVDETTRNTTLTLSWDPVTCGTFQGNQYEERGGVWYKLYAGDTPDFICDDTHHIITLQQPEYSVSLTEDKKFFKIVVVDDIE